MSTFCSLRPRDMTERADRFAIDVDGWMYCTCPIACYECRSCCRMAESEGTGRPEGMDTCPGLPFCS